MSGHVEEVRQTNPWDWEGQGCGLGLYAEEVKLDIIKTARKCC